MVYVYSALALWMIASIVWFFRSPSQFDVPVGYRSPWWEYLLGAPSLIGLLLFVLVGELLALVVRNFERIVRTFFKYLIALFLVHMYQIYVLHVYPKEVLYFLHSICFLGLYLGLIAHCKLERMKDATRYL